MTDRPSEPVDPQTPEPGELPERTLSEILEELALLSHAQQGEASEMRSAVSELSRSLARLFEMIRTDRRHQHTRIAELERELAAAKEQLAALGIEPIVPPAPNDFDQLRAAAERLRVRTEQLVRDSTLPAPPSTVESSVEPNAVVGAAPTPEPPVDATSADETGVDEPAVETPTVIESPAILRVLPGTPSHESSSQAEHHEVDLDVESELPLVRAAAISLPEPATPEPVAPQPAEAEAPAVPAASPEAPATSTGAQADAPEPASRPAARPEPIAVAPRAERKRGFGMRRRRIDARKLADVEPTAALGSMVGAVQQLWTVGCSVDLVVAFTDGGAVRVAGGDRNPLRVEEVEPGTPARCTVTATRRQLVPLFGRLELTDDESAPLIHGSRRDADLLVGWFDRAQRLAVEPL